MAHAVVLSHMNGTGKRSKHVAFILKGKRMVAVGINSSKTHPIAKQLKTQRFAETQCAELNACIKMGLGHKESTPNFSQYTMVVVRVKEGGKLASSKPCVGCQQLIQKCGFKHVIFSDENGYMVKYK